MPRNPRGAPAERARLPRAPRALRPVAGKKPERPEREEPSEPPDAPTARSAPSLAGLGIAGVSRRRVAWAVVAVLGAWVVLGFGGQAAEASRAAARLADEQARSAQVAADTSALRRELDLVTQERWILQQARAYSLGSRQERPFALAPDTAPLPPDAPGSATTRLGADVTPRSPLESWLQVLFGPGG